MSCRNHAQVYYSYIKVLCLKNPCLQEFCNMWQEISIIIPLWLLRNKWHIYWVVQTMINPNICLKRVIQFASFITQKKYFPFWMLKKTFIFMLPVCWNCQCYRWIYQIHKIITKFSRFQSVSLPCLEWTSGVNIRGLLGK